MGIITIQSKYLQLAEPLMQAYFDFDYTMLIDEINSFIEEEGIDFQMKHSKSENGIYHFNSKEAFYSNENFFFWKYTDIGRFKEHEIRNIDALLQNPKKFDATLFLEQFNKYFSLQETQGQEVITEDDKVLISLIYMGYIYYKEKTGEFHKSKFAFEELKLGYQILLHKNIYPEMMSLYRMILESKNKKRQGAPITISYKGEEISINTAAWFLDDMEKYFKDRFPDITLNDINRMFPKPTNKAGRKFTNRTINNLIWGTYQLLYNHHSAFKNSGVKMSTEICQFVIDYLDYLEIENCFTVSDIRDWLKYMTKQKYQPTWDLPWKNIYTDIKEKIQESEKPLSNSASELYKLFESLKERYDMGKWL